MINKEMRILLSDCYFSAGHCLWLRIRHLNDRDRAIYQNSKQYGEFKKINSRWCRLSAVRAEFEDLVGNLGLEDANRMFWTDASNYAGVDTIGIISEFLEVLRLHTGQFREDHRKSRQEAFKIIKQITGKMDVK